jgi:hypothetical protein
LASVEGLTLPIMKPRPLGLSLSLLSFSVPAFAFLPERDEFEPLRIESCDIISSPSLVNEGGCFAISGQVWAENYVYSDVFGQTEVFSAVSTSAEFRSVSNLSNLLTEAKFTLAHYESSQDIGSSWELSDATVAVGSDDWLIRAGAISETALATGADDIFGNVLEPAAYFNYGFIRLSGVQATGELVDGLETSVEVGLDDTFFGDQIATAGASIFYSSDILSISLAGWREEWTVFDEFQIENSFKAVAEADLDDISLLSAFGRSDSGRWQALFSARSDVGSLGFAGVIDVGEDGFSEYKHAGVEAIVRPADALQFSLGIEQTWRPTDLVSSATAAAFLDVAESVEAYGKLVLQDSGGSLYETTSMLVEGGIRYMPNDDLELSAVAGHERLSADWPRPYTTYLFTKFEKSF